MIDDGGWLKRTHRRSNNDGGADYLKNITGEFTTRFISSPRSETKIYTSMYNFLCRSAYEQKLEPNNRGEEGEGGRGEGIEGVTDHR